MEVPAGRSLPLAAGANGSAEEAVVLLSLPAGSTVAGGGGAQTQAAQRMLLRSQPFSLEGSSEGVTTGAGSSSSSSAHLVLRPEPPAPLPIASRLWGAGGSSAGGGSGGLAGLECRLAARVEVQQHAVAGGDATVEAASVTITAGCYVTNLSELPLAMLLEGAAAGSPLGAPPAAGEAPALPSPESSTASVPNGSAARPGALLAPAATVPLLQLWQAGGGGFAGRHQRQRSWSSTGDMLRSLSGGLLASSHPAHAPTAGSGGPGLRFALASEAACAADGDAATPRPELQQEAGDAAAPLGAWSAALPPYAAAGRQRLYLQQPAPDGGAGGSTTVMLTYRVLLTGGAFHLVLFR